MITYRKAGSDDVAELADMRMDMVCGETGCPEDMLAQLWNNTRDYLARGLAEGSLCLWVAENGGELVAMSCLNYFFLPPNDRCMSGRTAYLGNMYTAPAHRRKGVAKQLLEHNLAEARARDIERVILNTTEMGRALYESAGFSPWGEAMAVYPLKGEGSACGLPNTRYGRKPDGTVKKEMIKDDKEIIEEKELPSG